jgi:hypothetical protein
VGIRPSCYGRGHRLSSTFRDSTIAT